MTPEIVYGIDPLARLLLLFLIVAMCIIGLLAVAICGFAVALRDDLGITLYAMREHAEQHHRDRAA